MTTHTCIYHTDSTFNRASYLFYLYVLVCISKLSEDNFTPKYTSDAPPKISPFFYLSRITINTLVKVKNTFSFVFHS